MSIFETIADDVGNAVHWVEGEAESVWDMFKSAVTAFTGTELAQLKTLVGAVIGDVERGDLAALETAVLNAAEGAGATFLADMESMVVQPVLGVIAGKLGWLPAAPAR